MTQPVEGRMDSLLDEIETFIKSKGATRYTIIIDAPDSDEYGGRTGDTVWAVGAMTLYLDHLRKGSQ